MFGSGWLIIIIIMETAAIAVTMAVAALWRVRFVADRIAAQGN